MSIKIYLTFDVEDFVNSRSTFAFKKILEILDDKKLTGIFFITGHKAEELRGKEEVLDLLSDHIIGYHSSSHSVRPTISEFTNIREYWVAKKISKERETSYIDPLSGEIKGKGGIRTLRELFPYREINTYRAPGLSWSPPHTEALRELGINRDFSTSLFPLPSRFKNMDFFPFPTKRSILGLLLKGRDLMKNTREFLKEKELTFVLLWHPSGFVNDWSWDFFYSKKNPEELKTVPSMSKSEIKKNFDAFSSLLGKICLFERSTDLINVETSIGKAEKRKFDFNIKKEYNRIAFWARKRLEFEPVHLKNHLKHFLDVST